MTGRMRAAQRLHEKVPPNWYYASIRRNVFQRYWHSRRFSEVGEMIERVDGRVLDIGCADGVFTNVILERSGAREVVGIDVLEKSVEWAKNHWKDEKRLRFQVGDAHKLKFKGNTFGAVFALEVMEHVEDPDSVLKEIKRVLKPGGYAIVLVPTDNLLFRAIWWVVTNFMWARIWEDCHVQSFNSKNSLAKKVESLGFKVEEDRKFLLGMLNAVKMRK